MSKTSGFQELSSDNRKMFALKDDNVLLRESESLIHKATSSHVCSTDSVGYATPGNRSPMEAVVHVSEGFIPLWTKELVLRWRFDEGSLAVFQNPEPVKDKIRGLLGEALLKWGDASPIGFSENPEASDFQIVVRQSDNCTIHGCTLASAFFPDRGRHDFVIYPKMFGQSRKEQVDTMLHELGHVFGLRHFFAKTHETAWPSEIFGTHKPFSIMNYGNESELTDADRKDLKKLYQGAWSGALQTINGTPIRFVKPFHYQGHL